MTPLYRNREWLQEQHHAKRLSIREMASVAKCDKTTIIKWMDRYEIPRRNHQEAMDNLRQLQYGA